MPEEPEVETKDMQETIDDLHEKRERGGDDWVKFIGLSTAVLAVFAAVGAMLSGSLVNEALINQVKASDSWNEYEASKSKDHLYTITINSMLDAGVTPGIGGTADRSRAAEWTSKPKANRLKDYEGESSKEQAKEGALQKKAQGFEKEVEAQIRRHHRFAYSVALIQVAIALGAIAALARVRSVWLLSLGTGLVGIGLFIAGFLT